jgi:hypothetical protein
MVGVKKVVGRFGAVYIPLFIGAYGVFCNEANIGPVKACHALRERKNSQPVNAVMREETP